MTNDECNDLGTVDQLAQDEDDHAALATRLAQLEHEVAVGMRDARSLVAIPEDLAVRATLTFPDNAFGKPEPW